MKKLKKFKIQFKKHLIKWCELEKRYVIFYQKLRIYDVDTTENAKLFITNNRIS